MRILCRNLGVVILTLAALFLSEPLCQASMDTESSEAIHDTFYIQKLRESIASAKETIDVSIETVAVGSDQYDAVTELLNDLVSAVKRGVVVRLFLNTYSASSYDASLFLREDILKNFREYGLKVHFVNPKYHLTDHLVVFDGKFILEGGPPWTSEGFSSALSSATWIVSEEVAEQKRRRLELFPLWNVQMKREARQMGELAIPLFLLKEIDYLPAMIRSEDGDALKIYLALLRVFYETQNVDVTVPFEDLTHVIPADKYYEETAVVFQVFSAIERLAKNYNLLEVVEEGVDRMRVRLKLPTSLSPVVGIPTAFFDENFAKELSPHAIYVYAVILYRSQMSGKAPVWLGSENNIQQDFPISSGYFRSGVAELRELNLIEVYPFFLRQKGNNPTIQKPEHRYLINAIPSLSDRLATWDRLRTEFGEFSFTKARGLAKLLGEPDDPKVIATYIDLLQRFSVEDIRSLTKHVARLDAKSTPAMLDYLVLLLQNETGKPYQLATF